jgi:hypothetical protein
MKRNRLRLLIVGTLSSVVVLILSAPAGAKMIPLEVQVSDGTQTVRVPPADAIEALNDGRAQGHYGIFTYASRPATLNGHPLRVDLIIYSSRSEPGGVHDMMNPDVVRQKVVAFDYYRTGSGAAAQIREGNGRTVAIGRWAVLSPSFVDLVERAISEGPQVKPINPPLDRYEPHPASLEAQEVRFARSQRIAVLTLVVVASMVAYLVLWSWGRVRRGADVSNVEPAVRAG